MVLVGLHEETAKVCRGRLQSQVRELEWSAWLAGNPALLFCGACHAPVPADRVVEGLLPDWPYCPIHRNRPLTIRSASRQLPA